MRKAYSKADFTHSLVLDSNETSKRRMKNEARLGLPPRKMQMRSNPETVTSIYYT